VEGNGWEMVCGSTGRPKLGPLISINEYNPNGKDPVDKQGNGIGEGGDVKKQELLGKQGFGNQSVRQP